MKAMCVSQRPRKVKWEDVEILCAKLCRAPPVSIPDYQESQESQENFAQQVTVASGNGDLSTLLGSY